MGMIPSGYKRLDWLESTGDTNSGMAYIDTGIKPDATTEAEGVFSVPNNVYGNFFGARNTGTGASNWFVSVANINPSKSAVWYNTTYTQIALTGITGNSYYWKMKINQSKYTLTNLQTQTSQSVNYNATSFPDYNIYVLARNQNDAPVGSSGIRCKWFKISKSGVPVIDLIPVLRLSDGKPGMWDTISETFFTTAGTKEFLYSCETDTSPLFYLRQGLAAQPHLVSVPSAAVASFNTDFPAKLDKLQVGIDLVQTGSGNPSPDNVRPITGRTGANVTIAGVNLLNPADPDCGNYTINNDGTYNTNDKRICSGFIPCNGGDLICAYGEVYATSAQPFVFAGIASYDKDKNFITRAISSTNPSSKTVLLQTSANTRYVRYFESLNASAVQSPQSFANGKRMLTLNNVPTSYVAYDGTTIPVTWQTEAGTVYEGSVDVASGTLTVTWESITLNGTEVKYEYGSYTRWSITPFNDNRMYYERASSAHIKSDRFISVSAGGSGGSQVACYINGAKIIGLQHVPGTPTTADAIKAWLADNPTQIVFRLNTPKTYQLTPTQVKTLLGQNNIWADTGNVSCAYWKHD